MTIEEYIELSKNMPNTSDGGSACYHFDDAALIKYTIPSKYGIARQNEENIRTNVNKKRQEGVRTPAHIDFKRTKETNPKTGEDIDVCWVLQELAPGKNFSYYRTGETPFIKLIRQEIIANAPIKHYQTLIKDLMELLYFGIEMKPKNIYYDENKENGGFTIIDLLEDGSKNNFNPNSLPDIKYLKQCTNVIENCGIDYYDKASSSEKDKSEQLRYQIRAKIFQAMASVIPNFSSHRRWILRSYDQGTLNYFNQHGIITGNLSLTETEKDEFASYLRYIADSCIEKIASGNYRYWQIMSNEIRIALDRNLLNDAWLYHSSNHRNLKDYNSEFAEYDWKSACKQDLEDMTKKIFIKRFKERIEIEKNQTNPNEHLLVAFQELEESERKQANLNKVGV